MAHNVTVSADRIVIKGQVSPATSQVIVAGLVPSKDGQGNFQQEVRLPIEENVIGVSVTNSGKSVSQNVIVTREFAPEERANFVVSAPQDGSSVVASTVTVGGTASENVSLKVNGTAVTVMGGTFSHLLNLKEGSNEIHIEAKNEKSGLTKAQTLYVNRQLTEEEKLKAEEERKQAEVRAAEEKRKEEAAAEAARQKEAAAAKAAVAKMRTEIDDIKGITWYYDASLPKTYLASNVQVYFGKEDGAASKPWLRFKVFYYGDDWLFIEKYIFNIDGANYNFVPAEVERDNYTTVWEWSDTPMNSYTYSIVRGIADSKVSKVRFEGDKYYKDHEISMKEKNAIANVLKAYESLGGSFDQFK